VAGPAGTGTADADAAVPQPPIPRQSLLRFFAIWLALGTQSFGGGPVTLALIRRAAVDTHHWMTEAEFTRDWALVQMAPGVNLLGATVLIGRRAAGGWGVALALAGLLLPSGFLTALISAFYVHFATLAAVHAAVRGIVPATVGLGLLTSVQMARPLLADSRREGAGSLAVSLCLLLGSAAAYALWPRVPMVALLFAAAAIAALSRWASHTRTVSPLEPRDAATEAAEAEAG
jgi:chromate transporter